MLLWSPRLRRQVTELSEKSPAIIGDWSREAGIGTSHCDTRGSWGQELMMHQDI